MSAVLIDTNLLIYLYDIQSPVKMKQAQRVLNELAETQSGRMSVQSLAEFMNVSIRKLNPPLSRSQALIQLELFTRTFPVLDLTAMIVMDAARGSRDYGLAYYDAQIWASARLNQISVIFSEDFNDGQVLEGIRFVNPFKDGFQIERWM